MSVLEIEGLNVVFPAPAGEVVAVRDLSLSIAAGECLGIVGESGAGKSQAFLATMGLLPKSARVSGSVRFNGRELLGANADELNRVRGAGLSMVFQDPLTSLTPHMRIVDQIAESLIRHEGLARNAARERALQLLVSVQVNDPERRLRQYPHELSGGMRQRVMIAIALACNPALVIADEPTTALDVTIQAQIIRLLGELKRERGMALALITHDFGIVAGLADRVVVMQSGRNVEEGGVASILRAPQHPHTQELLHAMPRIDAALTRAAPPTAQSPTALLTVSGLRVQFAASRVGLRRRSHLRALDGVDLTVGPGESVGIVGESGCGKSTLARAVVQLVKPASGHIVWLGQELRELQRPQLRSVRQDLQIVFQDPLASLDPRMTVAEIVGEPLLVHQPRLDRVARTEAAAAMLELVALPSQMLRRYPHELSGGQCQRVAIARAMILKPKLLVCDEAVSSLDVTTQEQVVELIEGLRRECALSLLFISHNLAVVRRLCDKVLVLYLGRMMELATARDLYASPAHPYTRGLLDAIPVPDPQIQPARLASALGGELPSPLFPPAGCVFHTRCPYAIEVCRRKAPAWEDVRPGQQVACHRWREWPALVPVDSATRYIQS